MPIQIGRAIVHGVQPLRPIINIPPDALKVRIRMRNRDVACVFVKFRDRIERWTIEPANGLLGCTEWKLGLLQGSNATI